MYHIQHYTWKEIPKHYGVNKGVCKASLDNYLKKVIGDYTMTVEFYPGEILDNDVEKIKVAVEDFNQHFPESKVEWDGEETNMYIILDTMEKQLWSFFDMRDPMDDVRNLKQLDKDGEEGWNCIRRVVVNPKPGQEFLWIECFAGSSVKRYLKGLLKKARLAQHVSKSMEFENWGNEHLYSVDLNKESLKYFKEFEN